MPRSPRKGAPEKLRQPAWSWFCVLGWLFSLSACAHSADLASSAAVVDSPARARRFVPPFAYEAYLRGELALAAGKPDEALLQLEMATAAPDEDAFLLSRLAVAQAQSGDRESAVRTLKDAERVNPCELQLWLTRGTWAEAAHETQVAEAAYQRARSCAPRSERALLSLYQLWKAEGRDAEALALLARAQDGPRGRAHTAALLRALGEEDLAAVRFALDSWLGSGVLTGDELSAVLKQVATRREPALALTFKDLPLAGMTPETRAELAALSLDRPLLRALLAQHAEGALGGPEKAARYALAAHDFERAELYASTAARQTDSALTRALHAEALSASGDDAAALQETRAVGDRALQRKLALAQLARLGLSALAEELAALATGRPSQPMAQ